MPGPEPTPAPEPAPEGAKEFTRADLAPATEVAPLTPEAAPAVDQGATPPSPMPAVEAPTAEEAPAPAPEEAPAAEAPKKGALPGRKTGTRSLPGKRSTLPGRKFGKEGEEAPKKSSKMLWVVVFLVVLGGGGAGLYFSGLLGTGSGGAPEKPQAGVVEKAFTAIKQKDLAAFLKCVKEPPDKFKERFDKAMAELDQYDLEFTIKKSEPTKCIVDWKLKYKAKPSSEPGGETNPQTKEIGGTDEEVGFEADGIPFLNLPANFPMPSSLMPK